MSRGVIKQLFRAGSADLAKSINSCQTTVSCTYITVSRSTDPAFHLQPLPTPSSTRLSFVGLLVAMSADIAMHSDHHHNDERDPSSAVNGHAVPKDQDCDMSEDDVPLVRDSIYYYFILFSPRLILLLSPNLLERTPRRLPLEN